MRIQDCPAAVSRNESHFKALCEAQANHMGSVAVGNVPFLGNAACKSEDLPSVRAIRTEFHVASREG